MAESILLIVVWVLCGVLALLLDARWESREYFRIPHFIAIALGLLAVLVVTVLDLAARQSGDTWRDRYHAKHKAVSRD